MIELLGQLDPAVNVSWAVYNMPVQVDWLHSGKRELGSIEQVYPSSGPGTVVPTAIFSIETYSWDTVGW